VQQRHIDRWWGARRHGPRVLRPEPSRRDEISLGAALPKSDTDSDIRLERVYQPPKSDEAMMLTEEINLDEELKKQEAAMKQKPQAKVKPKSKIPSPRRPTPLRRRSSCPI
jgi:hypothetical protein